MVVAFFESFGHELGKCEGRGDPEKDGERECEQHHDDGSFDEWMIE